MKNKDRKLLEQAYSTVNVPLRDVTEFIHKIGNDFYISLRDDSNTNTFEDHVPFVFEYAGVKHKGYAIEDEAIGTLVDQIDDLICPIHLIK